VGPVIIETERMNLRAWTAEDTAPLVELLSDPEVNEHVNDGRPITLSEADAFLVRYQRIQRERGWCRWFAELKSEPGRLGGFVGVGCTFAPDIELGWTLRRDLWGKGYATEAGRAALDYCFNVIGFDRVVSAIDAGNPRSAAVASRLGMRAEGTLSHQGQPVIRYVIDNPAANPPRDPRFIRNCDGEPAGSSLAPGAED